MNWSLSQADLDGRTGSFATTTDFRTASLGTAFANYQNKKAHYVEIFGLTPAANNTFFFRLVSGGVASQTHQRLLPQLPLNAAPRAAIGTVRDEAGNALPECVVSLRATQVFFGENMHSLWVNTIGGTDGVYSRDVLNVRQDPSNTLGGNPLFNDFEFSLGYADNSATDFITVRAMCSADLEGELVLKTNAIDRPGGGTTGNYVNMDVTVTEPATPSRFSIGDLTVDENVGAAVLTISLDKATTTAVSVQVGTSDGTAIAGQDYTAVIARTVTISAGAVSTTTSVPINNDTEVEGDETFIVTLSNPTGGATLADGTAVVTIVNDDGPTAIPGLTPWGLLALGGIMALALVWARRRFHRGGSAA